MTTSWFHENRNYCCFPCFHTTFRHKWPNSMLIYVLSSLGLKQAGPVRGGPSHFRSPQWCKILWIFHPRWLVLSMTTSWFHENRNYCCFPCFHTTFRHKWPNSMLIYVLSSLGLKQAGPVRGGPSHFRSPQWCKILWIFHPRWLVLSMTTSWTSRLVLRIRLPLRS